MSQYNTIPPLAPKNGVLPNETPSSWVDRPDVSVVIDGIDVRTALFALDLLRKKNAMYNAIRLEPAGSLGLVKRLFELEFHNDMPPPDMAVAMGATYNLQDAEHALFQVRNMHSHY